VCRRLDLDEKYTLTPVLREATGAAERVSELGREPGGADQDAKGPEGDWTVVFRISDRSASPGRGV
jgi:hypothetical protein